MLRSWPHIRMTEHAGKNANSTVQVSGTGSLQTRHWFGPAAARLRDPRSTALGTSCLEVRISACLGIRVILSDPSCCETSQQRHYAPVSSSLDDLLEVVTRLESNETLAKQIAEAVEWTSHFAFNEGDLSCRLAQTSTRIVCGPRRSASYAEPLQCPASSGCLLLGLAGIGRFPSS